MARPTIIVPNPRLTGGHQLKNAAVFQKAKAAMIVEEAEIEKHPSHLLNSIKAIINKPEQSTAMAERLHSFAKPASALLVATELVDVYAFSQRGKGA